MRIFVERNRLIESGMKIIVAVSGGPDSLALLHVLKELRVFTKWELHVAHLNHLLRPEARREAAFVQELAHKWGLPVTVGYCRIARLAAQWKAGVEETGRLARYAFLKRVASKTGAQRIAVGHHSGDQVETVLLHIIRGSGSAGLAGMPSRQGMVIRPLLEVTREEIEDYCRQAGIVWCTDKSNTDPAFLRNKIRHHLLPYLKEGYNQEIEAAVLRLAAIMSEENRFLNFFSRRLWKSIASQKKGITAFSLTDFLGLPLALQRRLLRLALVKTETDIQDVGFNHIEAGVSFLMAKNPCGELHFPRGVRLFKDDGIVSIKKSSCLRDKELPQEPQEICRELEIPGETIVPELGVLVKAEVFEVEQDNIFKEGNYQAFFDYDKIELPLYVRNRKPGDQIRVLGLKGTKTVKKLFIDLKIPRQERLWRPLIVSKDIMYWVVGCRRSEEAKITPKTSRVLVLTVIT